MAQVRSSADYQCVRRGAGLEKARRGCRRGGNLSPLDRRGVGRQRNWQRWRGRDQGATSHPGSGANGAEIEGWPLRLCWHRDTIGGIKRRPLIEYDVPRRIAKG
jgi:hypothetical protein